jgi:hypothetical protein
MGDQYGGTGPPRLAPQCGLCGCPDNPDNHDWPATFDTSQVGVTAGSQLAKVAVYFAIASIYELPGSGIGQNNPADDHAPVLGCWPATVSWHLADKVLAFVIGVFERGLGEGA